MVLVEAIVLIHVLDHVWHLVLVQVKGIVAILHATMVAKTHVEELAKKDVKKIVQGTAKEHVKKRVRQIAKAIVLVHVKEVVEVLVGVIAKGQ